MTELRYSQLVEPDNTCVRALVAQELGGPEERKPVPRYALVARLLGLLHGFRYIEQVGMRTHSVDFTVASRSGNCLGLAALVCSMLRHAGLSDREAFVCIGSPRGFHATTVHAYVAVTGMDSPQALLVDPETMRPERISPDELLARYSIFVLFNDSMQTIDSQQKWVLLAAGAAHTGASSS